MSFFLITPKILTFEYYAKNKKKNLIGMSWTCRKKSGQSNKFWVSYDPLKYDYKWLKMSFSWINPKMLTFEYYAKKKKKLIAMS